MNRLTAMELVKEAIKRGTYSYAERRLLKTNVGPGPVALCKLDTLHFTYIIEEPISEMQMTVTFYKNFCDFQMFPHPIILEKDNFVDTLRLINFANSIMKPHGSNGRLYIDEETLDITFAARVAYSQLETEVQIKEVIEETVTFPISVFRDMGYALFQVAKGFFSGDEAIAWMQEVWNC